MKKSSRISAFIGIVFLSVAMLTACATLPKPRPGLYVNAEYRFTAEDPESYVTQPTQNAEVFRAANPNVWLVPVFAVTIEESEGGSLDADAFMAAAQNSNPGSKRFKVLSNENVSLNDGTRGLALTYTWTWTDGSTKLQTASLWVLKDGQSISVNATTILGADVTPKILLEMVSSLKFL